MSSEAITRNDLVSILNNLLPPIMPGLTGEIKPFAGTNVPTGWLECDGSEVLKENYTLLYAAIGDIWGTASDANYFVLPDMRGKVPVGYDVRDNDFGFVGKTGGLKDSIVPLHNHTQNSHNHTQNAHSHTYVKENLTTFEESGSGTKHNQPASTSTVNSGSTTATNIAATATNNETGEDPTSKNLQPYAVVKYIICAQ